jgi:hypothetical protein
MEMKEGAWSQSVPPKWALIVDLGDIMDWGDKF